MNPVVLIPTYNESESIVKLLSELKIVHQQSDYKFNVIVIDDNSPDKTADVVRSLSLSWVHVLNRPKKSGLGPAYRAGFHEALSNEAYTHIVTMDADGSHRPSDLISLLQAVVPGEMVVLGTRWMPGGHVINWPKLRHILSRLGTLYARFSLGIALRDLTGGFRIYSVELLHRLNLSTMKANGYCFQIEMAMACHVASAHMIEVPITFVERINGKSKMSPAIAMEAFLQTTLWAVRSKLRRNADKLHYVK